MTMSQKTYLRRPHLNSFLSQIGLIQSSLLFNGDEPAVPRIFSHRLLFLPLVVLVCFIALYCVIEVRKLSDDALVRETISDPFGAMAQELEVTALHVKTIYEANKPTGVAQSDSSQMIRSALDELMRKQKETAAYLSRDLVEVLKR